MTDTRTRGTHRPGRRRLARRPVPRPAEQRRPRRAARPGRRRGHVQPDDLRQGAQPTPTTYDEQVHDLRARGVSLEEAVRAITTYDVRWACDVMRAGVRRHRWPRRPGQPRGRPTARARHRADDRRGAGAVVAGRPAEPVHQDPGDRGGAAGDHRRHRRGDQRQRHADLRPRPLRRGDGRLPDRPRARAEERHRPVDHPSRSRRSSSAGSTPRSTSGWTSIGTDEARRAAGQGGDRQRPAGLPALRAGHRLTDRWQALEAAGANRQRPLWASTSVKDESLPDTLYVDQPGRARHRQHDARGHPGRGRRPRRGRPATRSPATTTTPATCSTGWPALGIDYDDVIAVLEREGVEKFEKSWAELLDTVREPALRRGRRQAQRPAGARSSRRSAPTTRPAAATRWSSATADEQAFAATVEQLVDDQVASRLSRAGPHPVGPRRRGRRPRSGWPGCRLHDDVAPAGRRDRRSCGPSSRPRPRPRRAVRHGRLVAGARGRSAPPPASS